MSVCPRPRYSFISEMIEREELQVPRNLNTFISKNLLSVLIYGCDDTREQEYSTACLDASHLAHSKG